MLLQLLATLRASDAVLAKQDKAGTAVGIENDRCCREVPELPTSFLATPAIARYAYDGLAGRLERNLPTSAWGGKVFLAQTEASALS
jgi:hypothetical protein